MLKYHNMTKHAHIYDQIILCYCSGLVQDIKRMKIIIIGKNMKDCRGYFRADIFRYLYDDDDQSFEGHIGEDIGQDWNQLNGEVARVSPKIGNFSHPLERKQIEGRFDTHLIFFFCLQYQIAGKKYHIKKIGGNCDESDLRLGQFRRINISFRCALPPRRPIRALQTSSSTNQKAAFVPVATVPHFVAL